MGLCTIKIGYSSMRAKSRFWLHIWINDQKKNKIKKIQELEMKTSRRLSHSELVLKRHYQPPLPPFFFFCGTFLRVAPDDEGFCCRGGTTPLPPGAEDVPVADPGLGDVGGLLAVLLASLKKGKSPSGVSERSQTWMILKEILNLQRFMS